MGVSFSELRRSQKLGLGILKSSRCLLSFTMRLIPIRCNPRCSLGPIRFDFLKKCSDYARFLKNGLLKIPRSSWSSNSKFTIFSYFWIFRVSKFQNESCLQLSVVFSVFIRSLRNTLAPWTVSGTAHWLVASGDGLLTTNEGPKLAYSWGNGDFRQFVNTTRVRTHPLRRSKRSCFQNWCNKAYYSRESCFRRPQFRNR